MMFVCTDPAAAVFITKPVQKVAACFARLLSVLAKDVFGMGTLTGKLLCVGFALSCDMAIRSIAANIIVRLVVSAFS